MQPSTQCACVDTPSGRLPLPVHSECGSYVVIIFKIIIIIMRMSNETIRLAVGRPTRLGTRLCEPHTCPCGALVDWTLEVYMACLVDDEVQVVTPDTVS